MLSRESDRAPRPVSLRGRARAQRALGARGHAARAADRGPGHLLTWDELAAARASASPPPRFDLVLHDIATLDQRLARLDDVISSCRRDGGLIVIDDMHVPSYRRAMLRALDHRGARYFSLR